MLVDSNIVLHPWDNFLFGQFSHFKPIVCKSPISVNFLKPFLHFADIMTFIEMNFGSYAPLCISLIKSGIMQASQFIDLAKAFERIYIFIYVYWAPEFWNRTSYCLSTWEILCPLTEWTTHTQHGFNLYASSSVFITEFHSMIILLLTFSLPSLLSAPVCLYSMSNHIWSVVSCSLIGQNWFPGNVIFISWNLDISHLPQWAIQASHSAD